MTKKGFDITGTSVQLMFILIGITIIVFPSFADAIRKFVADIYWLGILLIIIGSVMMYARFRMRSKKH